MALFRNNCQKSKYIYILKIARREQKFLSLSTPTLYSPSTTVGRGWMGKEMEKKNVCIHVYGMLQNIYMGTFSYI